MDTIIIVFIVAVILIGIFCVAIVCRDVVSEEKEKKIKKNQSKDAQLEEHQGGLKTAPAPVDYDELKVMISYLTELMEKGVKIEKVQEKEENSLEQVQIAQEENSQDSLEQAPVEQVQEEVANEQNQEQLNQENETSQENLKNAVVFSQVKETLDEKYLKLPNECKKYYDEIVKYSNAQEGSKRYKNSNYEEYKIGKNRIVRMKIKNGNIVCEFIIPNLKFKNYVKDNKVTIKQAPIVIKLVDEAALSACKDTIDIVISTINEDKQNTKEQAKIKRRAKKEENEEKEVK